MSSSSVILDIEPLPSAGPWPTPNPFLFCVHHNDNFPPGNEKMGPAAPLRGRSIGMDFSGKDGWSMYHGEEVPGFPQHPHRGFETITLVREGLIDHSDSLGCAGRFGFGDTQWMTAGKGVCHSEMFPLLNKTDRNNLDLFQIWLNLPAKSKMVEPHYKMLWDHEVPKYINEGVEVWTIAGQLEGLEAPPSPPPDSWASQDGAHVAVWTITMQPSSTFTLPPAAAQEVGRSLYLVTGERVEVAEQSINSRVKMDLSPLASVDIRNPSSGVVELLLLQGKPIDEPVAQHGPFVMNTREEIMQAFADYQRTRFGGWPWPSDGPVNPRDKKRFATYADGQVEEPATDTTKPLN